MPAIPFTVLQKILPQDKAQAIYDAVGTGTSRSTATQSDAEKSAADRETILQNMLDSRRSAFEQQKTDAVRMAKFNALGNALTTLVQPLGWAAGGGGFGGATGGVQPYDNRQYLDAFNRAVKANDELRNIGLVEDEYRLKMADEQYRTAAAREAADLDFGRKLALLDQKHQWTLAEIDRRADRNIELARVRGGFKITRNGIPISEKQLATSWTAYVNYLKIFRQDVGRGLPRTEGTTPMSFDQFLGTPGGGGFNVEASTGTGSGSGKSGSGSGSRGHAEL